MTFDEQIATRTLWMEARSETCDGQRAVAHSFVNRLKLGRWGNCLAQVCLYPFAYSCWNASDGNRRAMAKVADDDPILLTLLSLVDGAVSGRDVDLTGGATHYFNPKVVPIPLWASGDSSRDIPPATFCGQFGNQLFYKDVQ